ncbi:hypothetical protein PLICRDRAFT_180743 [Plicaturopsis crispa FD-325 SS-3]|uniref:Uncharacterized protein n=1 Tax=Plicaturopsis crispa FD-325 SS-3 TaxID=944288 RepID=A0A0C9SPX5_PLICR|nr:hypothetical protein PLICRDRAFT_180743 [Plicaturopsis crispa FD-325 SS-3]
MEQISNCSATSELHLPPKTDMEVPYNDQDLTTVDPGHDLGSDPDAIDIGRVDTLGLRPRNPRRDIGTATGREPSALPTPQPTGQTAPGWRVPAAEASVIGLPPRRQVDGSMSRVVPAPTASLEASIMGLAPTRPATVENEPASRSPQSRTSVGWEGAEAPRRCAGPVDGLGLPPRRAVSVTPAGIPTPVEGLGLPLRRQIPVASAAHPAQEPSTVVNPPADSGESGRQTNHPSSLGLPPRNTFRGVGTELHVDSFDPREHGVGAGSPHVRFSEHVGIRAVSRLEDILSTGADSDGMEVDEDFGTPVPDSSTDDSTTAGDGTTDSDEDGGLQTWRVREHHGDFTVHVENGPPSTGRAEVVELSDGHVIKIFRGGDAATDADATRRGERPGTNAGSAAVDRDRTSDPSLLSTEMRLYDRDLERNLLNLQVALMNGRKRLAERSQAISQPTSSFMEGLGRARASLLGDLKMELDELERLMERHESDVEIARVARRCHVLDVARTRHHWDYMP